MEEKDHAGEGEQVEEELHPSRITEAQQLAHHLAIAWQSHSELPAIGWRQIGGQQHQQPAQAAEEGAVGRPADSQGGEAEVAEDQHVVGSDVDQHRRQGGEHHHPGLADAGEKAAEAVPQQNQDRSVEENVEIELLLDELLRRDVHDREQVVSERPGRQDQGVARNERKTAWERTSSQ